MVILDPRGHWRRHILIPDECQAMAWSPGGDLVLAGYFYSSADFDPGSRERASSHRRASTMATS